MDFFTTVEMPQRMPQWKHGDCLMLMGSCFTTHMGERFAAFKFQCDVNPYGVLYNPLSIATALQEMVQGKRYGHEELFYDGTCWHSWMHHSDFSSPVAEEVLAQINGRLEQAAHEWYHLDGLLLTWGSAWVYEHKDTGTVVGNCHKMPESCFVRRMLTVDEIVTVYTSLFHRLRERKPSLRVLFTVSPIRHVRDGLHANQLSKATLLLAIDALQRRFPEQVSYFPAYELLMDELRDYRFYAADMVHPSEVAIEWVWERLEAQIFSPETRKLMKDCEEIKKMLEHRPFHPESEGYKRFLGQIVLKIERLNRKCPYLDFEKEKEICRTRLSI